MEGSGRDLFYATIHVFTKRNWTRTRKPSTRNDRVCVTRFKPGTSQTRSRSNKYTKKFEAKDEGKQSGTFRFQNGIYMKITYISKLVYCTYLTLLKCLVVIRQFSTVSKPISSILLVFSRRILYNLALTSVYCSYCCGYHTA
jgi:hypothetical protein